MPKDSLAQLERRLATLEETVARLVHSDAKSGQFKDWRRAAGLFSGRDLMKEIDEAGRKIREADRKKRSS